LACGCSATPQAQPASDEELKAALRADIACLADAARQADDRKSHASTIAVAVRQMCSATYARVRELGGKQLNPQARLMYQRQLDERRLEVPTTVVLEERKKGRGSN